jgi:hypothetical protein
MRKLIDIQDNIVKDLKRLALESDRDLKNFIQDLLKQHVAESKKRGFKPLPPKK